MATWYSKAGIDSLLATINTALGNKVNSATYTSGLAGKVDTTDSRLTDQRVPTNGSVTIAKVSATGTPSATTYLQSDGTWSTPATGTGGATYVDNGNGTVTFT